LQFDLQKEREDSPLRSITHGKDKLETHHQDTSVSQHDEDVVSKIMPEWVNLVISERTGNEIEGEIEVCLPLLALVRSFLKPTTY
jgi:hypothetical protein